MVFLASASQASVKLVIPTAGVRVRSHCSNQASNQKTEDCFSISGSDKMYSSRPSRQVLGATKPNIQ